MFSIVDIRDGVKQLLTKKTANSVFWLPMISKAVPYNPYFCRMGGKKRKVRVLEKILVEDYAAEGRSLARVDGKVVFIERTVPGDVVDVMLFKSKKDWAEGYPVKFHEYSSRRVQPFCIHFGDCHGRRHRHLL